MLPTWQGQLWQAFTLFLYGLCIGSFSTVLVTRLQRGEQIVKGRSHCPHCQQSLGARDLLPVVSYLWLRGRCRHCRAPIPLFYLLLELGAGVLVGGATLIGGLWAGLTAILFWLALCALFAWRQARVRAGYAMVEAVLAILLFALGLASALDIFALAQHAGRAGARRTQAIALARARFSQVDHAAADASAPLACAALEGPVSNGQAILGRSDLLSFVVETRATAALSPDSCQVRVTVSCPTCSSRFGQAVRPVTVTGLVRTPVGREERWP